jgi:hypothetical protein
MFQFFLVIISLCFFLLLVASLNLRSDIFQGFRAYLFGSIFRFLLLKSGVVGLEKEILLNLQIIATFRNQY